MKSNRLCFSAFWLRAIPVILMFFFVGLASSNAQNYKPFNEAFAAVDNAINSHNQALNKGGASVNSTAMSPSQLNSLKLKSFEVFYFRDFLKHAKLTNDIAAAVVALDQEYSTQGQPAERVNQYNAAKDDLLDLITQ